MSLSPVNAAGWDPEEVLTSDQMNALQVELLKAIDGVGGGEYTLSADLVMNGPGEFVMATKLTILSDLVVEPGAFLQLLGTLVISGAQTITGEFNVSSTGEINIQNGGRIDVESGGDINLASGADLNLASGAELVIADGASLELSGTATVTGEIEVPSGGEIDIQNGGRIDVESGGDINLASGARLISSNGAEIQVCNAEELTINNSSVIFRLSLVPFFINEGTPGTPDWVAEIGGTWLMATGAGGKILFPLPLRVGDVITTLRMTLASGPGADHGSNPSDMPSMELIKVSTGGVTTVVQSVVDPVTGASYGSNHSVTMSGGLLPYTVTSDVHFVRVLAEGPNGGIANATRLCSIDGTLTARSFRGANEVY